MKHDPATIYLLHVVDATGKTARLHHAGHYIGSCPPGVKGFERRMREHRTGKGARITAAFIKAELTWVVARTWDATRGYEFVLKKMGGAARICPICIEEKATNRSV